jgi:hypothetical protein
MRFAVEAWAPEYGAATDPDLYASKGPVDESVERPEAEWTPIAPDLTPADPQAILFTDGVRRVDARVWINDRETQACPGICATYAAGAVLCNGRAKVVTTEVQRGLFTAAGSAEAIECRHAHYPVRAAPGDSPDALPLALQQRMGELEIELATAQDADLIVVDGPLRGRQDVDHAIGYVKSHHVSYLSEENEAVVSRLRPGERTPLFLTMTSWSRFSWYLKLPGGDGHPWAGVVRCEASADNDVATVIDLANRATAVLPKFASEAHKDPRAPQNLYPIAGLERELRRRLGDAHLLYRGLRQAAGPAA